MLQKCFLSTTFYKNQSSVTKLIEWLMGDKRIFLLNNNALALIKAQI